MQKVLFLRRFKRVSESLIRMTGGHIKVKDYFVHCLQHPQLDPYLYFTPDSVYHGTELWADIPEEKIILNLEVDIYDIIFVAGRDWKFLPKRYRDKTIINLLQSVDQCDRNHKTFRYLTRAASRICVSQEIADAIQPFANGPVTVIKNGIPLELFRPSKQKAPNSIFIWAKKQPALGRRLHDTLNHREYNVHLLTANLPRQDFAQRLGASDIFVCLPQQQEGFYLPALEGMASGCAVVCADAIGNRSFCLADHTCLMPGPEDYESHLSMIDRLLQNPLLKEHVRQQGLAMAQAHSLEAERAAFYHCLDRAILKA